MGKVNRKTFTAQFKAKIGLEAVRGSKTVNEIAQAHAVHPTQVSLWKRELLEGASTLFEAKRGKKAVASEHEDPERLYSEIGRLKVELDWLKKKSGLSL